MHDSVSAILIAMLVGVLIGLIIGIALCCLLLMFLLANARPHDAPAPPWETWRVEQPTRGNRR